MRARTRLPSRPGAGTGVAMVFVWLFLVILVIGINLALLAGAVWVVVKVLQATGVLS